MTLRILIGLCMMVSACGNEPALFGPGQLGGLQDKLLDRKPANLRETLDVNTVNQIDSAVMLFELPETGAQSGAALLEQRGTLSIWTTPDGIQVILRDGVLTGTRGLTNDLMAADVTEVAMALHNPNRTATRFHQYLDGEDQIQTRAFVCRYDRSTRQGFDTLFARHSGHKIIENCTTTDAEIENTYWFDTAGRLQKSRQWVGPLNGFLTMELLKEGEFKT